MRRIILNSLHVNARFFLTPENPSGRKTQSSPFLTEDDQGQIEFVFIETKPLMSLGSSAGQSASQELPVLSPHQAPWGPRDSPLRRPHCRVLTASTDQHAK